MKAAGLVVLGACWTASGPPKPIENKPQPIASQAPFVLDEHGLSPLDAGSVVTQAALADALPRYTVEPEGTGSSFAFNVLDRGERLFYVVPAGEAIFGIHVTSPRIPDREHGWRVGDKFHDAALVETCECWGNQDVATCYKRGTHVAVLFERSKHGLPCSSNPDDILGKRIDRLVWQPQPWDK